MKQIWEYDRYLASYTHIVGTLIREFDLSKANISILADKGIMSEQEYQYYASLPKYNREVMIGVARKGSEEISMAIKQGILEARKRFITENEIPTNKILSIKGDAIYVIGGIPIESTDMGIHTKFVNKNSYTSYYHLNLLELYYGLFQIENREVLDVKGIDDEVLLLHQNYMIKFLSNLFYYNERYGPMKAMGYLRDFYMDYINRKLDLGYYRRFDSQSMYDISEFDGQTGSYFKASIWEPKNLNLVDIGYNEHLLRLLQRILFIDLKK